MHTLSPLCSRLCLVLAAVAGMLLPGCRKQEPKAAAPETPGALRMKLQDPQAVLDFLEQSTLRLQDVNEDCALVAENHETLGSLVHQARQNANSRTLRCKAAPGSKTWSCDADFMNSGGERSEVTDFRLKLTFNVDDTSGKIQPESLVCLMAD